MRRRSPRCTADRRFDGDLVQEVPPTVTEMRARVEKTLVTYPWLVSELNGAIVGYAYAGGWRERPAYRYSVEVTVYVSDSAQRRGVGRALYEMLSRVLAAQGFHHALAVHGEP